MGMIRFVDPCRFQTALHIQSTRLRFTVITTALHHPGWVHETREQPVARVAIRLTNSHPPHAAMRRRSNIQHFPKPLARFTCTSKLRSNLIRYDQFVDHCGLVTGRQKNSWSAPSRAHAMGPKYLFW
jgi:hypothetical protein